MFHYETKKTFDLSRDQKKYKYLGEQDLWNSEKIRGNSVDSGKACGL